MEINPNHPMTAAMREQWMKLCAIVVAKHGGHVVIGMEDLRAMPTDMFLTVTELDDGIHLRMVDEATAKRLARKEGGLPT